MERCKPAHGVANDMRAPNAERIEHGEDIVPRTLLGIPLDISRHIGRRVASRVIGDAAIAAREMAHLRFPGAPVSGEFVHEDDRRAGAALFVVQLYAIVRYQGWHAGCSLRQRPNRIVVMRPARPTFGAHYQIIRRRTAHDGNMTIAEDGRIDAAQLHTVEMQWQR